MHVSIDTKQGIWAFQDESVVNINDFSIAKYMYRHQNFNRTDEVSPAIKCFSISNKINTKIFISFAV